MGKKRQVGLNLDDSEEGGKTSWGGGEGFCNRPAVVPKETNGKKKKGKGAYLDET